MIIHGNIGKMLYSLRVIVRDRVPWFNVKDAMDFIFGPTNITKIISNMEKGYAIKVDNEWWAEKEGFFAILDTSLATKTLLHYRSNVERKMELLEEGTVEKTINLGNTKISVITENYDYYLCIADVLEANGKNRVYANRIAKKIHCATKYKGKWYGTYDELKSKGLVLPSF